MKVFAKKAGVYIEKHMSRAHTLTQGENDIDDRVARRLILDNPESLSGDESALQAVEQEENEETTDGIALDPENVEDALD